MPYDEFIPLIRPAPPVRTCGSYRPGHDVHYIQARRLADAPGFRVVALDLVDPTTVQLTLDFHGEGDPEGYWGLTQYHHDAARIEHTWEERGDGFLVSTGKLLKIGTPLVHACFSVGNHPVTPCTVTAGTVTTETTGGDA